MTNKEKFIEEIEKIVENFEEPAPLQEVLSEQAYSFFLSLKEDKSENGELTEKGAEILNYMQKQSEGNDSATFTAKSIGEGLDQSSRSVSGGMRKLVSCGYVEKTGENPIVYKLTEKGKNLTF